MYPKGWPTLSHLSIDERSRGSDTTRLRQRGVTALVFRGGRSFVFFEGGVRFAEVPEYIR
jgi:hypothetical protein